MTPAAPPPRPNNISVPDGSAEVVARHADTVGAVVDELRVTRHGPSGETLAEKAGRVAGAVRGLSENLRVVEIDAAQDHAVLRSEAPEIDGDERRYHEVELHGTGRATLKRYSAKGTAKREAVPFPLTHEAIRRVAGQLA